MGSPVSPGIPSLLERCNGRQAPGVDTSWGGWGPCGRRPGGGGDPPMSKERARRRAEREREAAIRRASRERAAERRSRSRARRQALTGWLPRPHQGKSDVMKDALETRWAARLGALVVSVLVFPVLRLLVSRR